MANGSIRAGDETRFITTSDDPAELVNFGIGDLRLGVEAQSGSLISRGRVILLDLATVEGTIQSGAEVLLGTGATVSGAISQNADISLPPFPSIDNEWPATSQGSVLLKAGDTQLIEPGAFDLVRVPPNATLVLESGTYYFDSLDVRPRAVVRAEGEVTIEVRTGAVLRSSFVDEGGGIVPVTLRYRGLAPLGLVSAFDGSVLAPKADLSIGSGHARSFTGMFYAKTIDVRPGVTVRLGQPATIMSFSFKSGRIDADSANSPNEASAYGTCSFSPGRMNSTGGLCCALMVLFLVRRRKISSNGASVRRYD